MRDLAIEVRASARTAPLLPPPPASRLRLRWSRLLWFAGIHLSCLAVLWVGASWTAVGVCAFLYFARMFGVTAGFHRLLAHRAYEASAVFRAFVATLGTAAAQSGPIWWASVHRHHHRHSDTEQDFHSPVDAGFWWAHVGWLLAHPDASTYRARVPDLERHAYLRFLERWSLVPFLALVALTYGVGAWLGAAAPHLATSGPQLLVWGTLVGTVLLYHGTWSVNSLAHVWGARPYRTRDRSRNNGWVAVWTMGEGWHNNHHRFPASERQGFRWFQVDLSHLALRACSWVGLVRRLRGPSAEILAEASRP